MKCTYLKLAVTGSAKNIRGLGQVSDIRLGYKCTPTFGGGTITSLDIDRGLQSIVIRKTPPFCDQAGVEKFDALCIPLVQCVDYTIVDDQPDGTRLRLIPKQELDAGLTAPTIAAEHDQPAPVRMPSCSVCGQDSQGEPYCVACNSKKNAELQAKLNKSQDPPPAKPVAKSGK
jgi:hypothetical protein